MQVPYFAAEVVVTVYGIYLWVESTYVLETGFIGVLKLHLSVPWHTSLN